MNKARIKHLQVVIARLKREIGRLLEKPAPKRSDYAKEAFYRKAITTRQHAIAHRATLIEEYERRIRNRELNG